MKPGKPTSAKKAKIQRIATIGLGVLFTVLFVRMIAARDDRPAPPTQAAARVRDSGGREVRPPADGEWASQDPPVVRWEPRLADTLECAVPPDPFRVSARLRAELTGIKQKAPNSTHTQSSKKRIEIKLKGIVADHTNGEHIALVDDELLRMGDDYRGFVVVDIDPRSVTLDNGEERRVLLLGEE